MIFNNRLTKNLLALKQQHSGVAIIEFALILPVLLLILLGVIEFGMYFMKEQIVQRTVSTAVAALQQDSSDNSVQPDAANSGAGLVNYTAIGNYICAKSYSTMADGKSGLCAAGDWITTAPDTTGAPYYVALVAYVQESSFTELFKNYIPPIKVSSVFRVAGSAAASSAPGCDGPNIVEGGKVYGSQTMSLGPTMCCRDGKVIYMHTSPVGCGGGGGTVKCDEYGGCLNSGSNAAKPKGG